MGYLRWKRFPTQIPRKSLPTVLLEYPLALKNPSKSCCKASSSTVLSSTFPILCSLGWPPPKKNLIAVCLLLLSGVGTEGVYHTQPRTLLFNVILLTSYQAKMFYSIVSSLWFRRVCVLINFKCIFFSVLFYYYYFQRSVYLILCLWVFSLCTMCLPAGIRRGHQIPWDWSFRWLWATVCALRVKPRSSTRIASAFKSHLSSLFPVLLSLSQKPHHLTQCEAYCILLAWLRALWLPAASSLWSL